MKKTINGGVEFDTKNAEEIVWHDAEDNKTSAYLYRTNKGKYFLRTDKLQIRKGRTWCDVPMDGSAKGHKVRIAEEIIGLTENQAIDWFVANLVPKCFAASIQEQLGQLVSFDLGELEEPFARYCKDNGVTRSQAFHRALREWNRLSAAQRLSAIRDDRTLRDYTRLEACEVDETEKAIVHLQTAVAKCFGKTMDTECGAATLSISHDRIILTNAGSIVIAEQIDSGSGSITRHLNGRQSELPVE